MSEQTQRDPANLGQERPGLDLRGFMPKTALNAARLAVRQFLRDVKPTPKPGRSERIRRQVTDQALSAPLVRLVPEGAQTKVSLRLEEAFGKPLLVSIDLTFDLGDRPIPELPEDELRVLRCLLSDWLDRAVQSAWDNEEVAPVAVRPRVIVLHGPNQETTVLADGESLGFEDEIARVEDLYQRFGSPAADPTWHP